MASNFAIDCNSEKNILCNIWKDRTFKSVFTLFSSIASPSFKLLFQGALIYWQQKTTYHERIYPGLGYIQTTGTLLIVSKIEQEYTSLLSEYWGLFKNTLCGIFFLNFGPSDVKCSNQFLKIKFHLS